MEPDGCPTWAADGKTENASTNVVARPGASRAPSRARTAAEAGAERRGRPLEARVDPGQASAAPPSRPRTTQRPADLLA